MSPELDDAGSIKTSSCLFSPGFADYTRCSNLKMSLVDFHSLCPLNSCSLSQMYSYLFSVQRLFYLNQGRSNIFLRLYVCPMCQWLFQQWINISSTYWFNLGSPGKDVHVCVSVHVYSQPAGGSCPSPCCWVHFPGSLYASWRHPLELELGCPSSV